MNKDEIIETILAAADTCRANAFIQLAEQLEEASVALDHGQFTPGEADD